MKKMKFTTVLCFLSIQSLTFAQGQQDFVGVWKLKTVIDNSGKRCSGIRKFTLTLDTDSSYYMYFGGTSWVEGKWVTEGDKIQFDAQTIADPCMEWTYDKDFKDLYLTEDKTLIIDMFICGTVDGSSYFRKKR